ncbi:MAG TPA: ribonuclease H-like domain-containing protein [Candidatus Nanoarchaeia archaeon]|nr:ribonuclease H-like domain-containing protein [Candidatus Nanoarchaeia archaeon]
MLESSFIILEGISYRKEQRLWEQGIRSWNDFIAADAIPGISSRSKSFYNRKLAEAKQQLAAENAGYFCDILPSSQAWRLYERFKDDAVFLDIETTGLSRQDMLTVVGLYDGWSTKTMISQINLNIPRLKQTLSRYKLLVTFNGSSFDLPFLRKRYPGLIPHIPHLDIRTASRIAGLDGGLKAIEKIFGLARRKVIEDFHGGDAVLLWRMYKATGDDYYLNLLVEYNEEDVVNLKYIADAVVSSLKCQVYKPLAINP